MSAHTPGPWRYDETTLSICRGLVSIEDVGAFQVMPAKDAQHAIAYVPNDLAREEQEANARLIAAAPELLAACREALKWQDEDEFGNAVPDEFCTPAYQAFRAQLRAAIAKAEGR